MISGLFQFIWEEKIIDAFHAIYDDALIFKAILSSYSVNGHLKRIFVITLWRHVLIQIWIAIT